MYSTNPETTQSVLLLMCHRYDTSWVYISYIWRGLLVVGLIQWAMREPRFVERRRSNSTFFILYLSKPVLSLHSREFLCKKLIRMNNKNSSEELQSRREFFKKAAKAALPVSGAVVSSSLPNYADTVGTSYGTPTLIFVARVIVTPVAMAVIDIKKLIVKIVL